MDSPIPPSSFDRLMALDRQVGGTCKLENDINEKRETMNYKRLLNQRQETRNKRQLLNLES